MKTYIVHMSGACRVLVTEARNAEHAVRLANEEVHKGHFQIVGASTNAHPLNEQETAQARIECDATI